MSCAVLQKIHSLSEPISPIGQWQFLTADTNVRRYPGNSSSLLDSLRSEFSNEQLEAAKVVQAADDGDPILSPKLSTGDSVFVSLRRSRNGMPFDLVTAKGCLASDVPPSLIAYRDWTATKFSGNSLKNILVAASMESVVVLRSLGFPAMVAAGLDTLRDPQLSQLYGKCEFDTESQTGLLPQIEEIGNKNINLAFVLWDLMNIRSYTPSNVQAIATKLARVAEARNLDPDLLKVWRPTTNEIHDIATAADLGDRSVSMLAIRSSLETSLFGLKDYFLELRRPQDYGGAKVHLVEEIDRVLKVKYESPELSERLDHLHQVFQRTVVQPLLNDANSSRDSAKRMLYLAAANSAERWHESCRFVRAATHGVLKCDDPRSAPAILEETQQRRMVVDQSLKIYRELHRKQ